MANPLIEPRTLRGFRDFLPESMMPREALIETSKKIYRSYGFAPIDTPTLELFEILTGKGSDETDRQMYHFVDQGDRHVGMRFDLTVPLARFVAQHSADLGMPFKRYHIATVWRGENPQAGRYREFMQCDFDTIGTTSIANDIETGLVIVDLLRAIGFEDFQVRLNNRKILNGLLDKFGLMDQSTLVLRAIDKLPKMGVTLVTAELQSTAKLNSQQISSILFLAQISGNNAEILHQLEQLSVGNELAEVGCNELRELIETYEKLKINSRQIQVDTSIARGLDYYTGTIFETFLTQKPEIGSVCSGGRYDNLANLFTKEKLPGIGASLGLDRVLAAMESLKMLPTSKTPAQIMIANFDKKDLCEYFRIASSLRLAGLNVELYPEPKKLGVQFKFADRRGFKAVLVAGPDELAANQVQIKWLANGAQDLVTLDDACQTITTFLWKKLK